LRQSRFTASGFPLADAGTAENSASISSSEAEACTSFFHGFRYRLTLEWDLNAYGLVRIRTYVPNKRVFPCEELNILNRSMPRRRLRIYREESNMSKTTSDFQKIAGRRAPVGRRCC
jgi:hypothetical protein